MKGLILAGGFGTRLRPLTYTGAKQLIPVANKPIIYYGIEALARAGVSELGIVVGETAAEVSNTVGDGDRFGLRITYLHQEKPLGLAHAIKISQDFLGDAPFIMYLGDNILKEDLGNLVGQFKSQQADALILLTEVPNPQQFGVAVVDKKGKVTKLVEKPKDPPSNFALVGVYLFNANIHKAIANIKPSWRDELEITDAIQWLLENDYNVVSDIIKGWWKDTGKPEDIIDANLLVLENIEPSSSGAVNDSAISGRVRIDRGAVIEKSTVRGPAVIGQEARIINSFIGPFSSIGDGALIENSEIECSVVMEGARIRNVGHRIDRSIIGKNVEISQAGQSPRTYKFIIGDQSLIELVK